MDPVTFSNANSIDKRLYVANSPTGSVGWCACLFSEDIDDTEDLVFSQVDDNTTLTLQQSWEIDGKRAVYIFLKDEPDESTLVSNLTNYLNSLPWKQGHNYFFWLEDASNINASTSTYLELVGDPTGTRKVQANPPTQPLILSFGGYINLSISKNCEFDLNADLNYFQLTQTKKNTFLTFSNEAGTSNTQIIDSQFFIPMFGTSRGCIRIGLELDGANDWNAYDVGLRYFYPNENQPEKSNIIMYPILDDGFSDQISCQASFDLLNQLNEDYLRTYLAFADSALVLPTYLRSNFGLGISLTPDTSFQSNPDNLPFEEPSDESALLVFSPQDKAGLGTYYMVPQAQFNISMEANQPTAPAMRNLLCGLSGLETIAFMPEEDTFTGDILIFESKQAAYAPIFPIPEEAASTQNASLLTDDYLTAWLSVLPGTNRPDLPNDQDNAVTYISQPKGASLFYIDDLTTETSTHFLDFYEPTTAKINQPGSSTLFVPMGVYGSFGSQDEDTLATISDFETYILNPTRKSTIEQAVLSAQAALCDEEGQGDIQAVTTQGLLVEIDSETSCWTKLALAQNYTGSNANDPGPPLTLEFENLSARLRSAFQTNQQFLVVSLNGINPDNGKNILGSFSNTIQMEGWPFILNVPTQNPYGQYNNVLIFKFCKGSLYSRVQNPQLWTNSTDFNETEGDYGLNSLSSWLTAYVETGINQATDPDFSYFAQIVQDPTWNGVLALKTDIDLQNFPQGLQGLLAGIDQSQFNAHHFGVNVNQAIVQENETTKTLELSLEDKSSMFGLIYYIDSAFEPYSSTNNITGYKESLVFDNSNPYDFKTLSLKVLFENAKIKSYQSYIQLSIYEMFGSSVTKTSGNPNILILAGSYQDYNGSPSYSFNGIGDELIPLDNPVFNGVEVIQSNFNTLIPTDQSESNQVYCQFALWGYLNFMDLEGIDLLSFGSDSGEFNSMQGLSYSQLMINMNFNLDTPSVQFFEFDAGQLSFDLAMSVPRAGSLYNHFPIQFTGLASGEGDKPPSNQGYVSVSTPNLSNSGDISEAWYGLMFNFNMGTAGALGSKAGFSAGLIVSWTAATGTLYTGIQLPGLSTKSKLLSLQGILKLNIENIQLLKATEQESTESSAYLMLFDDITLKFFNKQFPPGVNIDFYLFGDPNPDAQPNSLGWYAAYNKSS